jgi:hypothetical protein
MPVLRFIPRSALLALLLGATSCGTAEVTSDRDSTIPVPAGSTYAWGGVTQRKVPGEIDLKSENSIVAGRLQRAIDAQMQAKGWKLADSGSANFYVHYHVGVKDQTQLVTDAPPPPAGLMCGAYRCYPGAFSWGYWGPPEITTREVVYREGGLMVDLEQASTGKLVWRGSWKDEISGQPPTDERVKEVVTATMKGLPAAR